MDNILYKMMINNAKNYLKNLDSNDVYFGKAYTAFDLASILSICLTKGIEKILYDIIGDNNEKNI